MGLAAQVQGNITASPANCIEDIGSKKTLRQTLSDLNEKESTKRLARSIASSRRNAHLVSF